MKRVFDRSINGAKIVIVETADGFTGTIWNDGRQGETVSHQDLEFLRASLCNTAGQLHPDYIGMEGARKRFLSFFPDGFRDEGYLDQERAYKDRARHALTEAAPLEAAVDADAGVALACRKALATNLLSRFESARLNEVLGSADGTAFVRAAATFALEAGQAPLDAMARAVEPHGRPSWPIVTYLPYLWAPEDQMFLKPEATKDFATRTGHGFAQEYEPLLDIGVYRSLGDLTEWTARQVADLHPADRIDVQSFIWVVGDYTDADRREGVGG